MLDYAAVERERHPLVRLVRKIRRPRCRTRGTRVLASQGHDALFTNAENVAMPLASPAQDGLQPPAPRDYRPPPVAQEEETLFRWLKLHRQMDVIFVYASTQLQAGRAMGIPESVLRLIPFHADHRFYRPLANVAAKEDQICAAGLEWRDYPRWSTRWPSQTEPQGEAGGGVAVVQAHERSAGSQVARARRCASLRVWRAS